MDHYRILYIERYRTIKRQVLPALREQYEVSVERGRRKSLKMLSKVPHDLVLIDVPAIRFSLLRFCQDLRQDNPGLLLLLLIAEETEIDELPKAHDYLRHPFTTRQLMTRLSRLLPEHVGQVIDWRGLQLDPVAHCLGWGMDEVFLTPKQSELIEQFLKAPHELLTYAHLMEEVWGTQYLGDRRTLHVHIHWLRNALEELEVPFHIETVRGKGYRLVSPPGEHKPEI